METKKVLLELRIQPIGIKKKYPNFLANYQDTDEFAESLLGTLEHKDNFKVGYEVANITNLKAKEGDRVGFIRKSGYMGKDSEMRIGIIKEVIPKGVYRITYKLNGRSSSVVRQEKEIIAIQDLMKVS